MEQTNKITSLYFDVEYVTLDGHRIVYDTLPVEHIVMQTETKTDRGLDNETSKA